MNLALQLLQRLLRSPPIVGFSSRAEGQPCNTEATGEFVANLATRKRAQAVNLSSRGPPRYRRDGVGRVGRAPCLFAAPRVAYAPAGLECRVLRILPIKTWKGNEQFPRPRAGRRRPHRQSLSERRSCSTRRPPGPSPAAATRATMRRWPTCSRCFGRYNEPRMACAFNDVRIGKQRF